MSFSSEVGWAIRVDLGPTRVVSDAKNTFTTYTFQFHIGPYTHNFTSRYSMLREFHGQLLRIKLLEDAFQNTKSSPPEFPPKKWLTDMTKPRNYKKREKSLLLYFKRLVSKPLILKNVQFQMGIKLEKHVQTKMIEIANDLLSMKTCEEFIQPSKNMSSQQQKRDEYEKRLKNSNNNSNNNGALSPTYSVSPQQNNNNNNNGNFSSVSPVHVNRTNPNMRTSSSSSEILIINNQQQNKANHHSVDGQQPPQQQQQQQRNGFKYPSSKNEHNSLVDNDNQNKNNVSNTLQKNGMIIDHKHNNDSNKHKNLQTVVDKSDSSLLILGTVHNNNNHNSNIIMNEHNKNHMITDEEIFFSDPFQSNIKLESMLKLMLNNLRDEIVHKLVDIQDIKDNSFEPMPDLNIRHAYQNKLQSFFVFDERDFLPPFLLDDANEHGEQDGDGDGDGDEDGYTDGHTASTRAAEDDGHRDDWQNDKPLWQSIESKVFAVLDQHRQMDHPAEHGTDGAGDLIAMIDKISFDVKDALLNSCDCEIQKLVRGGSKQTSTTMQASTTTAAHTSSS